MIYTYIIFKIILIYYSRGFKKELYSIDIMTFIEIIQSNIDYLKKFLGNNFPNTFRYFNNKSIEQIIKNHYKTLLYLDNNIPVGYAHIDYDIVNNKYWFGICVLFEYYGKGIGTKLIKKTLEIFKNSDIDSLNLTVDKSNISAYNLYLKYGFTLQRETANIYIMSLIKSNILYLPVSYGEAIDKLTILHIKMDKISDSRKYYVEIEFNKLNTELKNIIKTIQFYYDALKLINLQIWEDQDIFRYSNDDIEKKDLCIKIIEYNDARFRIKNKINNILDSYLKEQKGYNPKRFEINYISESHNYKLLNSIIRYCSIFNDVVIVYCFPKNVDLLYSVFKNDKSIEICPTLIDESSLECEDVYNDVIGNKLLFNYINSQF